MTETTQTERDGTRHTAEMSEAQQVGMATTGEFILRLLNDADRLAAIERGGRGLDEIVNASLAAVATNPKMLNAMQDDCRARIRALIDAADAVGEDHD